MTTNKIETIKHASLFSGVGGPDLAAEWMGWENVLHCERNDFGQRVLQYYWPNAISYGDITKTDFTIHRGTIDVLTGGFPCQPYSVAGKQKGTEDERHLWPEMLRAIREIAPSYVVGENVRGLVSWNGGLVFDEVQAQLENEGYEVFPCILPVASVNAPHKRERIFFVAYAESKGRGSRQGKAINGGESRSMEKLISHNGSTIRNGFKPVSSSQSTTINRCERCNDGCDNRKERQVYNDKNGNATQDKPTGNGRKCRTCEVGKVGNAPNPNSTMRKRGTSRDETQERTQSINQQFRGCNELPRENWENFPTQSPLCNGDDGLPSRLDGITFSKWRKESIAAGGNAIVPQVMYQIFKAVEVHFNSF